MKKFTIELSDDHLLKKGINSIIDFYKTISIAHQKFSQSIAFVTGINSPFLNVFFDLRTERHNSNKLIEEVSCYFNQFNVPWGWFIIPASLDNDIENYNFSLVEEAPAMYFNLLNALPELINPNISIREIDSTDDLRKWIQPINEGFQTEEDDDSYRKLNADLLQKGETKLRHFIGFYKGNLAAASTLFISIESIMLHNLATKTTFTKLGIDTALTLHMMYQAKNMGFKHCFLDSSEEVYSLYKKIGFKVYCTTLIYKISGRV